MTDRPSRRLAAFAVAVVAALGLGAAAGAVVGPLDVGGSDAGHPTEDHTTDGSGDHSNDAEAPSSGSGAHDDGHEDAP